MLNPIMYLTNSPKFLQKFLNQLSVKTILHLGLVAFWAVIIIGTLKEFI
jgi:hypothetical protein